jgi:hypothetical protein
LGNRRQRVHSVVEPPITQNSQMCVVRGPFDLVNITLSIAYAWTTHIPDRPTIHLRRAPVALQFDSDDFSRLREHSLHSTRTYQ